MSIAKWQFIRDYFRADKTRTYLWKRDDYTCGLCLLYSVTCQGCPVAAQVGKIGCVDTPWSDFDIDISSAHKLSVARAELKFLIKLANKLYP